MHSAPLGKTPQNRRRKGRARLHGDRQSHNPHHLFLRQSLNPGQARQAAAAGGRLIQQPLSRTLLLRAFMHHLPDEMLSTIHKSIPQPAHDPASFLRQTPALPVGSPWPPKTR